MYQSVSSSLPAVVGSPQCRGYVDVAHFDDVGREGVIGGDGGETRGVGLYGLDELMAWLQSCSSQRGLFEFHIKELPCCQCKLNLCLIPCFLYCSQSSWSFNVW